MSLRICNNHMLWVSLFLSKQQGCSLFSNADIVNISADILSDEHSLHSCSLWPQGHQIISSSQRYMTSSNLTFANCLSADNAKHFPTCVACGWDSFSLQRAILHFTACTHLMEPSAAQCSTTVAQLQCFQLHSKIAWWYFKMRRGNNKKCWVIPGERMVISHPALIFTGNS